jgi:NAD(P)-dependent dehydrogenase (short-subunit alcohol dehydrogenase family)
MFNAIPQPIRDRMIEQAKITMVTQKMGEPEDVTPTIIFLASDDSYYVTGQVIAATGYIGTM